MTSVICHPDYRDVTIPMHCRSGAVLTLDVTMSHISIKMRRVVTADPGVTCPTVHVRHWALLGFIGAQTIVTEREGDRIICKIWPSPPRRPLATYLQLAED